MNFGKLSKAYDSARHQYPADVMDYIFSFVEASSKLLDVGCGTGIATRQLAQKIKKVSGCDIDAKMIQTARDYSDKIQYYVAPADKMPFDGDTFDVLTSFGAFHWFCDDKSVSDLKRVLKNGGFFVVVNKNEAGDFRKNYEDIVEKVNESSPPQSVKIDYEVISKPILWLKQEV